MLGQVATFTGILVLIAMGAGIPLAYFWTTRRFVGQRTARLWVGKAVVGTASLGIAGSTLLAVMSLRPLDSPTALMSALMIGSGITGIVAMQMHAGGE